MEALDPGLIPSSLDIPEPATASWHEYMDTARAPLYVPDLEALCAALNTGLGRTYRDVRVQVKSCPDLRRLGCAWPGLGGAPCIVEVGGEPYAHNPRFRHVHYAVSQLQRCIGRHAGKMLGAGMAWPAVIHGHCGEVIANLDTRGEDASQVARVAPDGRCIVEPYPFGMFAGLANLFVSDGVPGPVLEVEVHHRMGAEGSFPQALRAALSPLAAAGDGPIALGGVFQLVRGQIRSHVMPDYDSIACTYYDAEREQIVQEFLQYYEPIGPGLLCFSVLWTGDPTGAALDLRPTGEHTHFFHPTNPALGSHYHYDVTPETVHYRGWFVPAATIHRVGNIYARLRQEDRQKRSRTG